MIDMGIMIILRSLNRAIYEKKFPLFYVTEVKRSDDDNIGEFYIVKSKIYNNETFKWEDDESILPLSEIYPHIDDLTSFFETWIDKLYTKLIQHMWIANHKERMR